MGVGGGGGLVVVDGAGEGPTHRKTRGKRVRLAALVWAVRWGAGRMSRIQRQGELSVGRPLRGLAPVLL